MSSTGGPPASGSTATRPPPPEMAARSPDGSSARPAKRQRRLQQGPARLGRLAPQVPDEHPVAAGLHQLLSVRRERDGLRPPPRPHHSRAAVAQGPQGRVVHVPRGQPLARRVEVGAVEEESRPTAAARPAPRRAGASRSKTRARAAPSTTPERRQPASPPVERQPRRARRPQHAKRPSRVLRPPDPDLALLVHGRDEPSVGRDADLGLDRRVVAHSPRPAPVVEGAHERPVAAACRPGGSRPGRSAPSPSTVPTSRGSPPRSGTACRDRRLALHGHDPHLAALRAERVTVVALRPLASPELPRRRAPTEARMSPREPRRPRRCSTRRRGTTTAKPADGVVSEGLGQLPVATQETNPPLPPDGEPRPVRAEARAVRFEAVGLFGLARWARERGSPWVPPGGSEGEEPGLGRVVDLEAAEGPREGGRRVALALELAERQQPAGLGLAPRSPGRSPPAATGPRWRSRPRRPRRPTPTPTPGVAAVAAWRCAPWPSRRPPRRRSARRGCARATARSRGRPVRTRAGPRARPGRARAGPPGAAGPAAAPVLVLRLPADEARPGLRAATRGRSRPGGGSRRPRPARSYDGEQARVDERVEHRLGLRATRLAGTRALDAVGTTDSSSSRSRTARVPWAVTRLRKISRTSGVAVRADALERRLGVLGQRAGDAADLPVGRAREEAALAVALLPEPRRGEGQQRQRAPLARAPRRPSRRRAPRPRSGSRTSAPAARARAAARSRRAGRASVRSEKAGASGSCSWQRIRKSSRSDSSTCTSASRTSRPRSRGEGPLGLGRAEREQLLELVDDHERVLVALAAALSAARPRCRAPRTAGAPAIASVSPGEGRGPAPAPAPGTGRWPGVATSAFQPRGQRGEEARAQERALAGARGPIEREQPGPLELLPQRLDLQLPAEEVLGVLLGERRRGPGTAARSSKPGRRRVTSSSARRQRPRRARGARSGVSVESAWRSTAAHGPSGTPGRRLAHRAPRSQRSACARPRDRPSAQLAPPTDSISARTTAAAKTSARASSASPRACSGAM